MKFSCAGAAAVAALCLALQPRAANAQEPAPAPPRAQLPEQQPGQQPLPDAQQSSGKVIFHRSIDENGETKTESAPEAAEPEVRSVTTPAADDAERRAIAFTEINLDVRLQTAQHHIAARADLTVRNDGKAPLERIPLQISSSLVWERVRVDGNDAAFTVATLNSDTDHTGQLHEAAIPLATPLAPGATLRIEAYYSGTIAADARRLLAIGTPEETAAHADWDEIGTEFTGLRGFGNVVWYPVSSVPAILGDGARVFDEIGAHKRRMIGARFSLACTIEHAADKFPNVLVVNGHATPLTAASGVGGDEPGIATARFGPVTLGFEAPSLFAAVRTEHSTRNANLYVLPADEPAVEFWQKAASDVTPFIESWLGAHARSQLTLLDLPDAHDAPFEAGAMLAAPIHAAPADELRGALVHALAHAYLADSAHAPPPAWLDEGVATFLGTLWKERTQGRAVALGSLEAARPALALAEPSSPGVSAGELLGQADSPVYYRTKAAYVLMMLRDIAGEDALSAALRAGEIDAAGGTAAPPADAVRAAKRSRLEEVLERNAGDLSWFFSDWVDADKGLPDLSIESIFPTSATPDSWLVAVNVVNNGYAAAQVPITVRSDLTSVTQRMLIPARGRASRRILIQGKPTEVQLNDGTVPETEASVHVTKLD